EIENLLKEKLGCFYRQGLEHLPYGAIPEKLNLAMFGQVLDMQPTTSKKRTFSDIVKSDIDLTSGFTIVAMVARSGSGKTATLVQLARDHFVIYAMCQTRNSRTPDFTDENFSTLADDVEMISVNIPFPN